MLLGIITFLYGYQAESLVLVSVGYLEIYDALGVFNGLVSSVVRSHSEFKSPKMGLAYSAQRLEIIVAFANTIYLLFTAMYMCKEGLERMLLPHHQHDDNGSSIAMVLIMTTLGLLATFYSAMMYENHRQLCRLLRPDSQVGLRLVDVERNVFGNVTANPFVMMTSGCICAVIILNLLSSSASLRAMDPLLSLVVSALMFKLAGPACGALSRVLLQGTPEPHIVDVSQLLSEIRSIPDVIACQNEHFWTNTYNDTVGTVEVVIKASADQQAVIQQAHLVAKGVRDFTVQVTRSAGAT